MTRHLTTLLLALGCLLLTGCTGHSDKKLVILPDGRKVSSGHFRCPFYESTRTVTVTNGITTIETHREFWP